MFYNNKYNACSQCATNRLVSEMHHQGCICSCHSGIVIKLKNKATLNHPFLVFSYPAESYWEYRLTVSICIIKNMVYWIYKMVVQINLIDFLENFLWTFIRYQEMVKSAPPYHKYPWVNFYGEWATLDTLDYLIYSFNAMQYNVIRNAGCACSRNWIKKNLIKQSIN